MFLMIDRSLSYRNVDVHTAIAIAAPTADALSYSQRFQNVMPPPFISSLTVSKHVSPKIKDKYAAGAKYNNSYM